MRIALVSREVAPLTGGGIGQFIAAAARLLSQIAEVTIFTTDVLAGRHAELTAAADPSLPPPGVRIVFVPEPTQDEADAWYSVMHPYSARVLEALKREYADAPPDLVEFCDYLGEGFVTLQAAETLDPFLRDTRIAVRVHTTAELCDLLNGHRRPEFSARVIYEFERFCLARADRVIAQGGDIRGTYERFYGADALGLGTRIRYPFAGPVAAAPEPDFQAQDRPVQILYLGRLERRKGVLGLISAVTGMVRDDFRLTLVGADTPTAPLGGSVRANLEVLIAQDPRIEAVGGVEHQRLPEIITAHDLVVAPSLWECWPYAALEPLHLNRPVLAAPVGGLVELVHPGRSGWLASGTDPIDLEAALEGMLDDREGLAAMIRAGAPAAHAAALAPDAEILEDYQALVRIPLPRGRARNRVAVAAGHGAGAPDGRRLAEEPPLVSAVIPYFRAAAHVRETVESLLAQSYERLEILIVNDGSFTHEDWILAELVARHPVAMLTQMNQGLGAARNFGISQSQGRYVLPLDADNAVESTFVERCVAVLEARPELAYVTTWSRFIDDAGVEWKGPNPGYEPLGNWSALLAEDNVAGDAAALVRRRLFDAGLRYSQELTSFEDWAFYRQLAAAGHIGAVIPERLLRYRVRADSMQATVARPWRERLMGEIDADLRRRAVRWTSSPPGP